MWFIVWLAQKLIKGFHTANIFTTKITRLHCGFTASRFSTNIYCTLLEFTWFLLTSLSWKTEWFVNSPRLSFPLWAWNPLPFNLISPEQSLQSFEMGQLHESHPCKHCQKWAYCTHRFLLRSLITGFISGALYFCKSNYYHVHYIKQRKLLLYGPSSEKEFLFGDIGESFSSP